MLQKNRWGSSSPAVQLSLQASGIAWPATNSNKATWCFLIPEGLAFRTLAFILGTINLSTPHAQVLSSALRTSPFLIGSSVIMAPAALRSEERRDGKGGKTGWW